MAALDHPAMPHTEFQWEGRNRIRIRTTAAQGQALSVQVSYHPGWHATVAGQPRELHKDGLGLCGCAPPTPDLAKSSWTTMGGWELRLCRWLSWLAITALAVSGAGNPACSRLLAGWTRWKAGSAA